MLCYKELYSDYSQYSVIFVQSQSCVRLFGTLWTVTCQAPLSMEFSRQQYWSGELFPSPQLNVNIIILNAKCHINMVLHAHLLPLQISFRLKFCSTTGLGTLLHVCLWTSDRDLSLLLTVALTGPSSLSLLLPKLSLSLLSLNLLLFL